MLLQALENRGCVEKKSWFAIAPNRAQDICYGINNVPLCGNHLGQQYQIHRYRCASASVRQPFH